MDPEQAGRPSRSGRSGSTYRSSAGGNGGSDAEVPKRRKAPPGGDAKKRAPKNFFLVHLAVHISVTAFLVLLVVLFFGDQIVSLKRDFADLRGNLTAVNLFLEENYSRSQRKRSPSVVDDFPKFTSGSRVAHLTGSLPYQHIQKKGRIGPWTLPSENFIRLQESNTEVEIVEEGVYFIYAQLCYLTSQQHNTFQITTHNGTKDEGRQRILSTCSCQAWNSIGEVSCFTGLARSFAAGDRIHVNQVEQNRIVHFGNGCSFLGIVLLTKQQSIDGV